MKIPSFLFTIIALLLCSCGDPAGKQEVIHPVTKRAYRFQIEKKDGFKIVYVFAGKDDRDTSYTYVLYKRGSAKPPVNVKDPQYVQTPAENVACLSNVFAGCLQKLGLEEKVIAVDNIDYICNEKIRANFSAGKVQELAKHDELDAEKTILLKPEVIFTFGNGNPATSVNPRLREADIPVVIGADQFETTPLSRAEWLRFVAAFFDKESLADSILNNTKENYHRLRQLSATVKAKPKVVTEVKYNDTWYVPGGKSFMAKMLNDAGAEYYWKNDTNSGSLALSYEEVFMKASDADFWLNVHLWNTLDDCIKQDERNRNFKAYKNGTIYNNDALNNGRGGNAYWETGLISPDEILADLIRIFHPELLPEHRLKYYRHLK